MSLTSLGVFWTRCLGQVVDLLVGSLAVSRPLALRTWTRLGEEAKCL